MYAISHKSWSQTIGDKRATKGRQMGDRWATKRRQNGLFFDEDFLNAEGVRDSVSFSFSCCDPQCRFGHISTRVN